LSQSQTSSTGGVVLGVGRWQEALRAYYPALLFGLRLWASVCLALYVAFWLELDNPSWAGASAAIVCQPSLGASLRKGWYRLVGTVAGAVAIVLLTAGFPQDRALFLGGLALWGGACALMATVMRNFAAYSAALAGYTAAIVAGDLLGATGGPDANAAFLLAVTRASEICIGIVCAGVVLGLTDFGGARLRLATLFATLSAEIIARFADTMALAGQALADTTLVRRTLIGKVIALDPVIDEALGESSQLRYHSSVLQRAVDGLFSILAGWRMVANHLVRLPRDAAGREAGAVLETLPQMLRSAAEHGDAASWMAHPAGLHRLCESAARRLTALPAETPSLRLLMDKMADALAGLADALNGLALLLADAARSVPRRDGKRLRVPDWLPAVVNAGRASLTIAAVSRFWIVTEWPSGAEAITFGAIIVILMAPRADQAYAAGIAFLAGTVLDVVLTATINFAVLPWLGTQVFAALALVIGLCLVPVGFLMARARQPWQTGVLAGMTTVFIPLLAPTNPPSFDPVQFYNLALAVLGGTGVALLAFRLLPPLSPGFRMRRLLALTLRDLRGIARGRRTGDWQERVFGRLAATPEQATLLQRAQLLAALLVGCEIIQLRDCARRLGLGSSLGAALAAIARGDSALARAELARLDEELAARTIVGSAAQTALRARAHIMALSEILAGHAPYFDADREERAPV
jgi:uncharacterized membrane protein YccC